MGTAPSIRKSGWADESRGRGSLTERRAHGAAMLTRSLPLSSTVHTLLARLPWSISRRRGPEPSEVAMLRTPVAVEQKRKRRGASLRAERLCSLGLPSLVVPTVPQPQPRFFFRSPQPMSHWQVATTSRCSDRAHLLLLNLNGGVHACVYTFPAPLTEYSGDSRSLVRYRACGRLRKSSGPASTWLSRHRPSSL